LLAATSTRAFAEDGRYCAFGDFAPMAGQSVDAGGGMGGLVDTDLTMLPSAGIVVAVIVVAAVAVKAAFSAWEGRMVLVKATATASAGEALSTAFFFIRDFL
jgi:hypothetical protein